MGSCSSAGGIIRSRVSRGLGKYPQTNNEMENRMMTSPMISRIFLFISNAQAAVPGGLPIHFFDLDIPLDARADAVSQLPGNWFVHCFKRMLDFTHTAYHKRTLLICKR